MPGIHIVLSTQCTHSNIISPLLKANLKTEIHLYQYGSEDNRLCDNGEDSLMGFGDMLFYRDTWNDPQRLQSPFVSSEEIDRVANFLIEHHGRAKYDNQIEESIMQYETDVC